MPPVVTENAAVERIGVGSRQLGRGMVLVLDDDLDRLEHFELVVRDVAEWTMKAWVDAPSMMGEVDRYFEDTV